MDQSTINTLIAFAGATLGWVGRMLWERQELLRADLTKLQVLVVGDYVHNDKLRDLLTEFKADIKYIRDRVDSFAPHRREGD